MPINSSSIESMLDSLTMSLDKNCIFYQRFNLRWNLHLPIPILIEALTHSSYKSVDPISNDNQRLETLGDAVINLLVIDWLYNHITVNEGILTKKRAEIVQNSTLAKVGKHLQVSSVLRCAPAYQIQEKDLADTVEAIFGALYITNGLNSCRAILLQLFGDYLHRALINEKNDAYTWGRNEENPKNLVQEFFQQNSLPSHIYQLEKIEGPDHNPRYWYSCQGSYQNKVYVGKGYGRSKKEAQKKAAYDLYVQIRRLES